MRHTPIIITDEQKHAANSTDLVSYLESQGFQFKKVGTSYKPIVSSPHSGDMSSLSIFENRKGWKRWSTGEHGGDAISFLQMNMGMTFQDAVKELTSGQAFALPPVTSSPAPKIIPENKALELPQKCDGKYSRAFAYLNKTRCIDANVISGMISEKKIYQDNRNNVVFVGFNEENKAAFACVRGTNTNVQYRGDCDGSDKRYAFSMDGINSGGKLYVFEAPIDLLSHATMANKVTKKPEAWKVHSRIALAGTSDVALEHYLKSHSEIKEIHFVLDNDPAGQEAAEKYVAKYSELGYKTVNHVLKNKDMNEELKAFINGDLPLKKNMNDQAALENAKYLINRFCENEYGDSADFSDLHNIPIAYTTHEDTELPIQAKADLIDHTIIYEYDGKVFDTEQFNSLEEMNDKALEYLNFNALVLVPDDVIKKPVESAPAKASARKSYYFDTSDPDKAEEMLVANGIDHKISKDSKTGKGIIKVSLKDKEKVQQILSPPVRNMTL